MELEESVDELHKGRLVTSVHSSVFVRYQMTVVYLFKWSFLQGGVVCTKGNDKRNDKEVVLSKMSRSSRM